MLEQLAWLYAFLAQKALNSEGKTWPEHLVLCLWNMVFLIQFEDVIVC